MKPDPKNFERAAKGSWSWRDGLICITTNGKAVGWMNTWHAGIVVPQEVYAVAEAPGPGKKVTYRYGMWTESGNHTVYQVAVNQTTVQQDWDAGFWAGKQKGKPYIKDNHFTNLKRTDQFYCSQLVWAAYYPTAKVDLNTPYGGSILHPKEFVENKSKTTVVYRSR